MEIKTLTVDISKSFQHVCAFDNKGKLLFKKICKPPTFHKLLNNTKACTVVMEACGGAHHWARTAKKYGHEPKLIAPKFVKPFVGDFKNDFNDALAIFEASSRPRARFVAVKSQEQQELTFVHRSRSRILEDRTQLINQLHAYVCELGYKAPKARLALRKYVTELCDPSSVDLTTIIKEELLAMLDELSQKDKRIKSIDKKLLQIATTHPITIKLMKVPGIGPITATALISEVGDFNIFDSGREFAAWLGLVPKQNTTGGKIKLGPITKAGNRYLRRLLIHGARSLYSLSKKTDQENQSRSLQWMTGLCGRAHTNIAVVAMANKLARIVWAIIVHDREYDPTFVSKPPIMPKKHKLH
jgi:transposase